MRRYLIFACVSLALILAAISSSSVAVAFPVITSSFNSSLVLTGWVLSIYQLVATAAMPLAGKASDIFGRKVTFIVCLSLFTIGSLLCALAPNVWVLILARFIQAVGGGGFMPTAAGTVADEFPRARQQAIGLFSSINPIGQIIGPNLGGWIPSAGARYSGSIFRWVWLPWQLHSSYCIGDNQRGDILTQKALPGLPVHSLHL